MKPSLEFGSRIFDVGVIPYVGFYRFPCQLSAAGTHCRARAHASTRKGCTCKSIIFVFCGRSLAPNTRLPTAIGQRFRSMQRCAWRRRLGGVHRRLPRCTRDTEEFSGSIMARNLRACPVESHARRFARIHQHPSSIRVGNCNMFFHDVDLDILCADRSQLLL